MRCQTRLDLCRPSHRYPNVCLDRGLNSRQSEGPKRLGNRDYRIGVIPTKADVFSANSMVSGPTNSRCSGIGNDRRGTASGSKHRKNRCLGLVRPIPVGHPVDASGLGCGERQRRAGLLRCPRHRLSLNRIDRFPRPLARSCPGSREPLCSLPSRT
jgi:hypothetical protein